MGNEIIAQRHPLKSTLIWVTLPYLEPVKKWLPSWLPKMSEQVPEAPLEETPEDSNSNNDSDSDDYEEDQVRQDRGESLNLSTSELFG